MAVPRLPLNTLNTLTGVRVRDDRGQLTVAAAGVLSLLIGAVAGLALIGAAMVERQATTVAADAVALAGAQDQSASSAIAAWYGERGIDVQATDGEARAARGQSRAHSRAEAPAAVVDAPAMIAVLARARQLVSHELATGEVRGVQLTFTDPADARRFALVADELIVCEVVIDPAPVGHTWQLC